MRKIYHLLYCIIAVLCLPVSGFAETVSDTLVQSNMLIPSDTLLKKDCFFVQTTHYSISVDYWRYLASTFRN